MVTYEWAEKSRSYWANRTWSEVYFLIENHRITCAPWRLKVRKHVGSWSLGVTLCWVTVRSEWTTNCARGGMDAALGLDAIVAPTAASEEGSWVTVKNKGRCISEPKEIQNIVSPELDYLNMSDVLHNSAAASWVCVAGGSRVWDRSKRVLI
jgi:hypothetical protein